VGQFDGELEAVPTAVDAAREAHFASTAAGGGAMMRYGRNSVCLLFLAFFWLFGAIGYANAAEPDERKADVYFFWQAGCPHCGREKDFLKRWEAEEARIRVHDLEISRDAGNYQAFLVLVKYFGIERPGVPLTVIGETFFDGYNDDSTTGAEIKSAAKTCLEVPCRDLVGPLLIGEAETPAPDLSPPVTKTPKVLKLPIFGEVAVANVSLPLLTLMLAAVDGFNPCAMWTLVFLISLLVGLRDRFRMWVLGSAFIVASAAVYYLFMAAWLNLLLFFGMLVWIRLLVGVLALGGGGYYLHEYFANPEAICKATAPEARRHVFERLRSLAGERNFLLALGGIVLLAFAVNLVELICSAGIPAVYTQVLALSNLPAWQYHAYLGLYILVFMLDDLFVFFVAMQTLRVTGLTGAYVRHAHAIGGAVLIVIGLLLLFRPEWLAFSV
jgi:glutaredoxin